MKINDVGGATPLEPEELLGLIPKHITTQAQLNAWEQQNIVLAVQWAKRQKHILTVDFLLKLHKRMFNETWLWAGKFRQSGKNIGIDWPMIPGELKNLCDDVIYQLTHQSFTDDEIAVRLHHRLVLIHPFPNGNGRHARLVADLLLIQLGHKKFSWGMGQNLQQASAVRRQYIDALRSADRGSYAALLSFARS